MLFRGCIFFLRFFSLRLFTISDHISPKRCAQLSIPPW